MLVEGGIPIVVSGKIVGGIGVWCERNRRCSGRTGWSRPHQVMPPPISIFSKRLVKVHAWHIASEPAACI